MSQKDGVCSLLEHCVLYNFGNNTNTVPHKGNSTQHDVLCNVDRLNVKRNQTWGQFIPIFGVSRTLITKLIWTKIKNKIKKIEKFGVDAVAFRYYCRMCCTFRIRVLYIDEHVLESPEKKTY
jgi:hypothetical protein